MPTEVLKATTVEASAKDDSQDPVYLRLRDLVYQSCGIYHSEEKLYLLVAACRRRMTAIGSQVATPAPILIACLARSLAIWKRANSEPDHNRRNLPVP